jgi:DNA-binding transcriptional MerR regulator
MSSERYLNASEAAELTGKSLPTIRHYLATGKLPNATQRPKGKVKVWVIPLTDLQAAGLLDKVSGSKQPSDTELSQFRTQALEHQLDLLQTELRLTRELLAERATELERYRQREQQFFLTLETRESQERRRFSWFRRNTPQ